jgi:hypothetical protein
MIENNRIEFTDGLMYYKGIKLDISREVVQELHNNHWGKKEASKLILESYKRCLRLHREEILKNILNDTNRN